MNQLSGQDPEHVPDYRRLFSLDQRVFVVLGGGAGIGRQSSHALAQAGATVVVVDTDPAAVAAEVGGIALTADVTRCPSVEGVFADAARQAGPVRGRGRHRRRGVPRAAGEPDRTGGHPGHAVHRRGPPQGFLDRAPHDLRVGPDAWV